MRRVGWQPWIEWTSAAMRAKNLESLRQLAEYSHVPIATLHGNMSGGHRPSETTVRAIARYFGVDADYLLQLAGYTVEHPEAPIGTVLPGITAGVMTPYIEASAGGGFNYGGFTVVYPPPGASTKLVLARVRGDCMAPQIVDGDVLVVDTAKQWRDGSIVLARLDNDLLIKRAYRENGHIRLKADAPGYADVVDQEIHIIGVVVELTRQPE